MKLDLNETLNQLLRNYKRTDERLDFLLAFPNYKDARRIDAEIEVRDLERKFNTLIDRVKEEYGDEVQSLLLYAAEYIFTLEADNNV